MYADKHQYSDQKKSYPSSSKLLEKNVIQIPAEIFYPYTRNALKKAIYDSGYFYVPSSGSQSTVRGRGTSLTSDGPPLAFSMSNGRFTNGYFESNAMMSDKLYFNNSRRNSAKLTEYLVSSDPYNIDTDKSVESDVADNNDANVDDYRKKNGEVSVRSITLKDFLGMKGNKVRADGYSYVETRNSMIKRLSIS